MSYPHLSAVAPIENLSPSAKLTLYQLANVACETCGIAWPGVQYLSRLTGLGPTVVRESLKKLERDGWIAVHHYAKGGRERATEYIVMPNVMKLSTAPCAPCGKRMKRHRNPVGIEAEGERKAPESGGYKAKPTGIRAQYPPESGDHTVSTPTQSGSGPSPNGSGAATPPISDGTPLSDAENALRARRLIQDLSHVIGDDSTPTGKPEAPERR